MSSRPASVFLQYTVLESVRPETRICNLQLSQRMIDCGSVMADDAPSVLCEARRLYLIPEAKMSLTVLIPEIKSFGVTISNWEVMEKIKQASKPDDFVSLRVTNSSREMIHFEGELLSVKVMRKLTLLLTGKTIKLSGFAEPLRIQAKPFLSDFPTKKDWEEYFQKQGLLSFDEGLPGERPDTVRVRGLPIRWFTDSNSSGNPSKKVLTQVFSKFGTTRQVDIYDPSKHQQQRGAFTSFGPTTSNRYLNFEAYIQYMSYAGFCTAMGGLKGMKLMHKESDGKSNVISITVEYDKGAYLSERNIKQRKLEEEKMETIRKETEKKQEEEKKMEAAQKQVCNRCVNRYFITHSLYSKATQELRDQLLQQKHLERLEKKEQRKKDRLQQKQIEKERKRQKLLVVAKLKVLAKQRRAEGQRLLRVLLAGAAEAKYQV